MGQQSPMISASHFEPAPGMNPEDIEIIGLSAKPLTLQNACLLIQHYYFLQRE